MSKQNGKQNTSRLGILGVVKLEKTTGFLVKRDGKFHFTEDVVVRGVKYVPLDSDEIPWEPPRIGDYLHFIWPSEFGDRKLDKSAPWGRTSSPREISS